MSSIYFGGSRHLGNLPILPQVVGAVVASGQAVHVGCQFGADIAVIENTPHTSKHRIFAAHDLYYYSRTNHPIAAKYRAGYQIAFNAGGTTAPIPARYLLRSIAAFQGCAAAVFFQPGPGSLAVAREAIKAGLPVYAINPTPARYPVPPFRIPSTSGEWRRSLYMGRFLCWAWVNNPAQMSLF